MDSSLREALTGARPAFLFGTVPAMEGTPLPKVREQAVKFAAKMRELAADGYIVYDIQEEAGRTEEPRPFPFRRMSDPVEYAALLKETTGKECVVYKCVAEHDVKIIPFDAWTQRTTEVFGVECLNLVGGATSAVEYAGPTIFEAADCVNKHGMVFGGVTIAERHLKRKNEHKLIAAKAAAGAQWFISQAIYNPEPTIDSINAYGELCKDEGLAAKKILLTFTPCGRPKTMKFLHWLGVSVPEATEKAILEAENPVATSVNLLCDMFKQIILETAKSGVPLGISIEHVSIFREEVNASFDLFRRTQSIMLDFQGVPYAVRWSPLTGLVDKKAQATKKTHNVPATYIAFILGMFFANARQSLRSA